jgi:hypothetical protein
VKRKNRKLNDASSDNIPDVLKERLENQEGLQFLVRLADDHSHPDSLVKVMLPRRYYYKIPVHPIPDPPASKQPL